MAGEERYQCLLPANKSGPSAQLWQGEENKQLHKWWGGLEENGKRKSPLASFTDGDTVPSFPVVCFLSNQTFFFLFRVGLVTSCPSTFSKTQQK